MRLCKLFRLCGGYCLVAMRRHRPSALFLVFHTYLDLMELYLGYMGDLAGWLSEYIPDRLWERFTEAINQWSAQLSVLGFYIFYALLQNIVQKFSNSSNIPKY